MWNWAHSQWAQVASWWSKKSSPNHDSLDVVVVAGRLSVFIRAGLSPVRAWGEVARLVNNDAVGDIARALAAGKRHSESVERAVKGQSPEWSGLSSVIAIADQAGAPLADVMWRFSQSLRQQQQIDRELEVATKAPRLTVGVLVILPVLGLLMASLLGVNAWGFLVGTPMGRICGLLAVVLLITAMVWMRTMMTRATPAPGDRGLPGELFSIAASGGVLPEIALERVRIVLAEHDLPYVDEELTSLAQLSRRVGVPVSTLAASEASWAREKVRLDAEEAHAALAVALLIPLGLLILPAFVLVAVVPVVVTLLGDVIVPSTIPW
jgi:tight adherence protein B